MVHRIQQALKLNVDFETLKGSVIKVSNKKPLESYFSRVYTDCIYSNIENKETRAVLKVEKNRSLRELMFNSTLALRKLRNNHSVVSLLESGYDKDDKYFHVYKHAGRDFYDKIKSELGRPKEDVLKVMGTVYSVLKEIHELDMVYHDMKLENILEDEDSKVRLCDFDLCKRPDNHPQDVYGTFESYPREIARGSKPTQKTDIYSLGIVLDSLVSWRIPKRREIIRNGSTIYDISDFEPVTAPNDSLYNIIKKATHSNPRRRYNKITEFWKDICDAENYELEL